MKGHFFRCYFFFSSGFLSSGFGGIGGSGPLPDSASRILLIASRLGMPISPKGETKLTNANAISSLVCSPNFTRCGGVLGLRGLSAELSYVYSIDNLVPAGSLSDSLYKY